MPAAFCPWDGYMFNGTEIRCQKCGWVRVSAQPSSSQAEERKEPAKPKWRKELWMQQPYDDNFVDETFLIGLIHNANVSSYDYWTVVRDSAVVTQQISTVAIFGLIFAYTWLLQLSAIFLFALGVSFLVFGYLMHFLVDHNFGFKTAISSLKNVLLLFGTVFGLSPVLKTLTLATSDDTIWALTLSTLLLHLFFYDYAYVSGDSSKYSGPVSLNAAIFASVLLSSRLSSSDHVFALIIIAIEIFALFPIMRHHLRKFSMDLYLGLTWFMFIIVAALTIPLSLALAILYVGGILFITFVCPKWLIHIQKYKNEIRGPWDEAVPSFDGVERYKA